MAVADSQQNKMSFCDIIVMNTYTTFFNPENPEITRAQSRDFGVGKMDRDPWIRDPELQSLFTSS